MKKKTIETTLFKDMKNIVLEDLVQKQESKILDEVLSQDIGSSKEEVYFEEVTGYTSLSAVHPDGKCGSTDQEGTNYKISIASKNPINKKKFTQTVYRIMNKFSEKQGTDGSYYWKASCEEIANYVVSRLVNEDKKNGVIQNLVEVIVEISPNPKTIVTTHWQDHLPQISGDFIADPFYRTELPEKEPIRRGCGF